MAKGLSAAKAKKILTDGYVKGKSLTAKQRKYFGAIVSGATPLKAINGGWLDKYQMGGSLPGASGMMYGRTSGNTPMEPGKLKKAQTGVTEQYDWEKIRENSGSFLENFIESPIKPIEEEPKSFYDSLINDSVTSSGGTEEDWQRLSNMIGYHESKNDPTAIQKGGGPGRGLYQFESDSFNTAANRAYNYSKENELELPKFIKDIRSKKIKEASELTPEQQTMLLLADYKGKPNAKLKAFFSGDKNDKSIEDFWVTGHWSGDKEDEKERRTSFQKDALEYNNLYPKKKNGGWLDKYEEGGNVEKAQVGKAIKWGKDMYKTSSSFLKNLYKHNPFAESLDDVNSSYRVTGMDAADDFIERGVVQSKNTKPGIKLNSMTLGNRPTSFPSFQKGFADLTYLPEKGGGVIFKTDLPTFKRGDQNPVTGNIIKGRHYAHRVIDPKTGKTVKQIPASDVSMYESLPHWLKGHRKIELPKSNFKHGGGLPKAQSGNFGEVNTNIQTTSGESAYDDVVQPGDPNYDAKYKDAYNAGAFASMPNQLDEVVINSGVDYEKYPYYNDLSEQDREYFKDEGAIGRGVRRRAQTKEGLAKGTYDVVNPLMYGMMGVAGGMMAGPALSHAVRAGLNFKPMGGPASIGNMVDLGFADMAIRDTPGMYDAYKENPNLGTFTDLALTASDVIPYSEIFTGFKGTKRFINSATNKLNDLTSLKPNFTPIERVVEKEAGRLKSLFNQPNIYPTSSPLPKRMEPYLSQREIPISKKEELLQSTFDWNDPEKLKHYNDELESRLIRYNQKGEVIPNMKQGGVIKDDRGQWAHPGEVTEISGNTMATHGYGDNPLYVVPDVGEPRIVEANTGTQTFPGATKFTEYPMAQNGDNVVKDFMSNYINSPKFKERLASSNYNDVEGQVTKRSNNIDNTNYVEQNRELSFLEALNKRAYDQPYSTQGSKYDERLNTLIYDKQQDIDYGIGKNSVIAHEYGHAAVDSTPKLGDVPSSPDKRFLLNDYDSNELTSRLRKYKGQTQHDLKPTENKSDLDAFRFELSQQGIYDAGKEDITKDILKKGKDSFIKKRLLKNYKEKDLMWLMNNIASIDNSRSDLSMMAKNGSSLVELNQLTNFTNYNTPQPGGWLDKY
jgi:hypothetical protein